MVAVKVSKVSFLGKFAVFLVAVFAGCCFCCHLTKLENEIKANSQRQQWKVSAFGILTETKHETCNEQQNSIVKQ